MKTKRQVFSWVTFLSPVVIFTGCAFAALRETDPSNFRSRVSIRQDDYSFYSGVRTDSSKLCFPPAAKTICKSMGLNSPYRNTGSLEMKHYNLSLSGRNSFLDSTTKDLAHLAAAELAMQLNYKSFIIDQIHFIGRCSSNNSVCSGLVSVGILFYKNYEDVKGGVFYKNEYTKDSERIYPYTELYLTVIDKAALIKEDYDWNISNPIEAWKSFYNAAETAQTLATKYHTSTDYKYKVEIPALRPRSTLESLKRNE